MKNEPLQAFDPYFTDFLDYFRKAGLLEQRNHFGLELPDGVGDPLMDNVTIYDTVHRRYAGFSNVLRDLHWGLTWEDYTKGWDLRTWLFIYGVHRMTGSGASFFPKWEEANRHGYKNTVIFELTKCRTIDAMVEWLRANEGTRPIFTTLGNQCPPFPKPVEPYKTAGIYFFCEIWPSMVTDITSWLTLPPEGVLPYHIEELTNHVLWLCGEYGCKRFKFTLTAFVMDLADWWPSLVDPASRCHYGENGLTAMNAIFSTHNRRRSLGFYHACMDALCAELNANPMDVEDALCDAVRYWSNFVPRHGYDHLTAEDVQRTSLVDTQTFLEFEATR